MDQIIQLLVEYGSLGIVCACSFYYIMQKDKEHIVERNKLQDLLEENQEQLLKVVGDQGKANEKVNLVINDIKTKVDLILQKN